MMRILLSNRRNLSLSASLLAAVLLASCGDGGGVGDGNTLARLNIVQFDLTQPSGTLAVPRCIPTRLRAIGTFDDGSQEDMTLRVNWSSSGVVPVSNGATAANNGADTFLKGVLTPSGTVGNTDTIRIDFVGLSAQQAVSIQEARLELSALQSQLAVGNLTLPLFLTGILGTPGSQIRISANDRVVWQSSNESLATVSSLGVVTPVPTSPNNQAQDVIITADTGIGAACNPQPSFTLKLHNKALTQVRLLPASTTPMAPSTSRRFTAVGTYGDYSQDITGLARYAAVDANNQTSTAASFTGSLLSTSAAGQVNLKASLDQFGETGDGTNDITSNTVALTITNATLANFVINQSNPKMIVGTSLPFTATGTFSDGTTQDLSLNLGWTSSDTSIAAFSTAFGFGNILNALQASATPLTVTATRSTSCGDNPGSSTCVRTTSVTTDATLASLKITNDKGSDCSQSACPVALGSSGQLRAIGTLASGGTQDLTESVIWSVSNPSPANPVATVSNATGIAGRALGRNTGTVSINARYANVSASGSVIVQQDTDGDGVADADDQCANTPAGTPVNANGCPDSDGDGVQDADDQCANTPTGATVNAAGCHDRDGDGVFDNEDFCPDQNPTVPSSSPARRGCECQNQNPLPIGPRCLDN